MKVAFAIGLVLFFCGASALLNWLLFGDSREGRGCAGTLMSLLLGLLATGVVGALIGAWLFR